MKGFHGGGGVEGCPSKVLSAVANNICAKAALSGSQQPAVRTCPYFHCCAHVKSALLTSNPRVLDHGRSTVGFKKAMAQWNTTTEGAKFRLCHRQLKG